jgi:hypothetical protein
MYRLAYRNFGDHEAMVVNHTIEVGSGSSLHSGVRWYEIRPDASRNLSVFQQGTYAPDNNWRWMASAAMDRVGNIALGYSVAGSVRPQIHYTGRLASDPAGTMSQGENVIIDGGGSQTSGLARWGDYTSMAVDPSDGCTFWYTNEYLQASGSFNWSTRIASFNFPGCLGFSQSPQGNWVGSYGADGYALLGWNGSSDLVSLPVSNLVLDQGSRYQWTSSTNAVQALQSPDTSTRRAACFFDGVQLRLHLTFPAAYSGTLHLYALDWDRAGRRESLTVNDGSGLKTANITTDFSQGAWVHVPINVPAGGSVTISVTLTAGANAVLSGIFLR